jgi:hypothetical protein
LPQCFSFSGEILLFFNKEIGNILEFFSSSEIQLILLFVFAGQISPNFQHGKNEKEKTASAISLKSTLTSCQVHFIPKFLQLAHSKNNHPSLVWLGILHSVSRESRPHKPPISDFQNAEF